MGQGFLFAQSGTLEHLATTDFVTRYRDLSAHLLSASGRHMLKLFRRTG